MSDVPPQQPPQQPPGPPSGGPPSYPTYPTPAGGPPPGPPPGGTSKGLIAVLGFLAGGVWILVPAMAFGAGLSLDNGSGNVSLAVVLAIVIGIGPLVAMMVYRPTRRFAVWMVIGLATTVIVLGGACIGILVLLSQSYA